MLLPKPKEKPDEDLSNVTFNKPLAASLSFIVGIAAGIVGAAGAFILVPIMIVVLKIPTRMTIASSLAITFISSIGTAVGKIATGQVLLLRSEERRVGKECRSRWSRCSESEKRERSAWPR